MSMKNPKRIVTAGYDACASAYAAVRSQDDSPELGLLIERIKPSARILDIGCGAGIPVTQILAQHGDVVGVDISVSQVELARHNVPGARFILGDIARQEFDPSSFDAIVAFYALFHIPRSEHQQLLARISDWLVPGGYLLATLPRSSHPGYTEPDFFGVTMYWSHYETSWYEARLEELGFNIIHLGVVGSGYREVAGLPPERHPVVLAQQDAA